ncbi:hypothetical protein KKA02_04720 [Patescibacteria group bacterium]|nr:hypothetical protein [Patescibacteria group bacterium]
MTAEQAVADWWHNGRMPTVELLSSAEMYRVETLLESGDFDIGELNFQADSDSIQAIASVPHNTQADDIFVVTLNEVLPHWQMIADSLEWVGPAVTNEVAVAAHWPAHLVQEQGMSLSAAANLLQNGIQAAFGGAEGSRFIFRQAGNGYQEAVYAVFKWQDRIVITVLNPENGAPITAFARRTSKAVSYMKSVSVRETTEILDPSDPRLSEVRRVWQGRPNIWRFFVWVVKGKLLAVQIGVTMWVEAATAFTAPSTELFFILGYIPRTEWVEEDTLG